MNAALISRELRPIYDKVLAAERISDADANVLYASHDLNAVGAMADLVRERKNGNVATYLLNRYINYSNVCLLSCQFCAFAARKRDAHAFEQGIPEIVETVRGALAQGITEVHMVGGLHPSLTGEWYLNLLRSLRALDPNLHLKCFTAIEVRHLSKRVFKLPLVETLALLRDAGLGSLTGGGAEIFDQGVRDRICRGKETGDEWLDTHRTWHRMGGRSTSTMLFGHVETMAQRVDHLRRLRELQDETGGFTGFIPFAFVPEGVTRELRELPHTTGFDELRNLAVSRIYLDNFEHLTAYWVAMACRWRRSRWVTAWTICTARSWRSESSRWPGRKPERGKPSPPWKKRSAKPGASRCSETRIITGLLRQPDRRLYRAKWKWRWQAFDPGLNLTRASRILVNPGNS